ncbi:hypothetical protein ACFQ0P_15665 [Microbacterium insulae]|uniref:Uncharacterized protein n=1 Tax=Microbacterium insulae TaxID=483014 RepID=A0ABW3AND9_9MICO
MGSSFGRGTGHWRRNHPEYAGDASLLADIARDHPDWPDEDVIARLAAERRGPGPL